MINKICGCCLKLFSVKWNFITFLAYSEIVLLLAIENKHSNRMAYFNSISLGLYWKGCSTSQRKINTIFSFPFTVQIFQCFFQKKISLRFFQLQIRHDLSPRYHRDPISLGRQGGGDGTCNFVPPQHELNLCLLLSRKF